MALPSFVALQWRLCSSVGGASPTSPPRSAQRSSPHGLGVFPRDSFFGEMHSVMLMQSRQLCEYRHLDISAERVSTTLELQKKACAIEGQPRCISTDSAANIQNPQAVVEVFLFLLQRL